MSAQQRYGRGGSTPHTARQHDLERYKEQFQRQTKFGENLLAYLNRSNCGIWRCERDTSDARRWWLNFTLPNRVADMFDAHLEIQLVYAEYDEVEPRLLEQIQKRIATNARLDRGLMAIASLDPDVDRLTHRRRGEFAAINLHLPSLNSKSDDIRTQMSHVLTTVDHYDLTTPVHGPSGFFGRTEELQQIVSAIQIGQSVGVFGLRKTGKTSLLNFVFGQRKSAEFPVVWVDISGLSEADDFRVRLLESTWKALSERAGSTFKPPRLRTLNRDGELKVSIDDLRLHWLRDLESLSQSAGSRLEVFIDEIDQLEPSRSSLGPEASSALLVALTQLRGMIQSPATDSGMVLICAGVDPALFERPLLASRADNLLYKLVRLQFLAPMNEEEVAEMVRDLGRRMGVRVRDHEVVRYLFAEYGGHALLTRKACSLATKGRPRDEVPWRMTMEAVVGASAVTGDGSPGQQASEILTSFSEWFPEEEFLLRALWSSDPEERELALSEISEHPGSLRHAVPYGLLNQGTTEPRIRAISRAVKNESF